MSEINFIQLREKRRHEDNLIINLKHVSTICRIQKTYGKTTSNYVEITMINDDKFIVINSLIEIKSLIDQKLQEAKNENDI